MTAVEFWRDIEARFRALQSRSHDSLYAVWLSTGWSETGDQWRLRGADRTVRVNFEWSAERAAVELGHHGGRSAVVFWLDLLKHESPNYKVTGSGSSDNGVTRNEHGKIKRVCEASADYCLRLETQGIAKGAIRMSGLSRGEIEKFADDTFAVARDRILAEYAEKLNHAPAQARLTGNSGAYLPTVIRQAIVRSRAMILARAASYVEAFNQAEVPSDKQAEKNLETFAHQSVAGSISKVRGELRLRSVSCASIQTARTLLGILKLREPETLRSKRACSL